MNQEELLDELDVGDLVEYLHDNVEHKSWILSFHNLKTIRAMVESGYYTILRVAKYSDIVFMESEEYKAIIDKSQKEGKDEVTTS